jgi:hypothetical protein
LANIPKPKPHIPSIDKTWQKQTWTLSQYWQNLAKPGPSKPFEYWQNLAKPKPPLPSLGKTMQNQNQPFLGLCHLVEIHEHGLQLNCRTHGFLRHVEIRRLLTSIMEFMEDIHLTRLK